MNIEEIATMSINKRKKPDMAFDTIVKIIEQSDKLTGINKYELANLYRYFSLKPKTKSNKFDWLGSLCGDRDEHRYVFVSDGYIFSTNGFAVARCVNDLGLTDGAYDPNGVSVPLPRHHVSIDSVNRLFDPYNFDDQEFFDSELCQSHRTEYKKIVQTYYFNSMPDRHFEKKLYDKVTAYSGLKDKKYVREGEHPLVIGDKDLCVMIMPRRN